LHTRFRVGRLEQPTVILVTLMSSNSTHKPTQDGGGKAWILFGILLLAAGLIPLFDAFRTLNNGVRTTATVVGNVRVEDCDAINCYTPRVEFRTPDLAADQTRIALSSSPPWFRREVGEKIDIYYFPDNLETVKSVSLFQMWLIPLGFVSLAGLTLYKGFSLQRNGFSEADTSHLPQMAGKADVNAELMELIRAGQRIEAIKKYREMHGVGLKEARDAIEAMKKLDGGRN
jgi:hypothetical protein